MVCVTSCMGASFGVLDCTGLDWIDCCCSVSPSSPSSSTSREQEVHHVGPQVGQKLCPPSSSSAPTTKLQSPFTSPTRAQSPGPQTSRTTWTSRKSRTQIPKISYRVSYGHGCGLGLLSLVFTGLNWCPDRLPPPRPGQCPAPH